MEQEILRAAAAGATAPENDDAAQAGNGTSEPAAEAGVPAAQEENPAAEPASVETESAVDTNEAAGTVHTEMNEKAAGAESGTDAREPAAESAAEHSDEESGRASVKDVFTGYGEKIRESTVNFGAAVKEQAVKAGTAVKEAAEKQKQNAAVRTAETEDPEASGSSGIGTVRIADDVVAMIASVAAQEVDGVAGMAAGTTREFLGSIGMKDPQKGVRVDVMDRNVRVDLQIIMEYGYNIPATSSKVQSRVKQAIENMTGLSVTDVNVRIAGIKIADSSDTND